MIDPTPASSAAPVPSLPALPFALPPWLGTVFGALVAAYCVACAVGALWPTTRLGAACIRWAGDIRRLAARQPDSTPPKEPKP